MKAKTNIIASSILALALVVSALVLGSRQVPIPLSGVNQGNEYHSTTTSSMTPWPTQVLLDTGPCTLGSVTQTAVGSAAGMLNIYDATTTNVSQRTGQKATTTILLASIPYTATVGTYVFDSVCFDGLLVVQSAAGTTGTTTITFRP